ncbi:hypothetical protein F5I97DRAFT_1817258 [Phlebopus sp. FC_14]|nr:hypothetical protein F5I97DRAFT_1817258 [Phlebopus sp. FC_14]
MSGSPIRRLSTASPTSNLKREENLINAYEAEEERIINVLSRKLEQLREEKIQLENALEAESESHVNRLNRELSALRQAQQQQMASQNGSVSASPESRVAPTQFLNGHDPTAPSPDVMLEAMRRENEQLRNRLVDTERDYVRISRLNEIYREELLDHRRRLGLSVDNLVGLSSPDPYSQPTHRRSTSNVSSPNTSVIHPSGPRLTHGVPIPRPTSSSVHRPTNHTSETTTPLSHSPSSAESPFVFSPVLTTNPASYISNGTTLTTPLSSASLHSNPPAPYPVSNAHTLTYPSVPPPSLSSSYGSPVVSYVPHRDSSTSPAEPLSRRGSNARGGLGAYRNGRSRSRRESAERGARIAETGTLIPRSRSSSQNLASTTEASDSAEQEEERQNGGYICAHKPPFFSMSYQYPNVAGYSSMPTTPQTPFQWEGGDPQQLEQQVLQHPLQQQQQPQDVYATSSSSSSTTMQFQEQVPIVPSQNPRPGHLEADELHLQASGSIHHENMRPHIHVDTTRHVHVGASASPPSAGGAYHGTTGPVRSHVSPSHTDARMVTHPYRRPQSAARTGALRSRRELEESHSVRYSSRQPSGSSLSMPAPTRRPTHHSGTTSATSSLVSPAHAVSLLPSSSPKFIIRTDIHYNPETSVLTAMLELPGLKKSDLSIVLSTCYYNRVKQVVVTGRNRPVFSDNGYAVKERKFGEFTRTLVVAHETKVSLRLWHPLCLFERSFFSCQPEDVYAEMQDGILTIKIRLPPPPEEEEGSQEIAIH